MFSNHHKKNSTFSTTKNPLYLRFDLGIVAISFLALLFELFKINTGTLNIVVLLTVSIIGLIPVLISAAKALWHRRPTIDLLASVALIFSLLAHEWTSAIFINLMLAFARLFARYTERQTERSIESLLKLRPTKAHILVDGKPVEVEVADIKVGDLVIVDLGERIAVDGVVESGEASIDQSSLTGESEPVIKKTGDEVLSSTLNIFGSLVVKATKIGKDTTFAKILELVEKSQNSKTPITSITENFTKWYIIATLVVAVLLLLTVRELDLVLSILLVTCADDLAVAIPLAFTAAIGAAAKNGIIIKGGSFLEGLKKTKIIVFDKTGTLTEGKMKLQKIETFDNYPKDKFVSIIGTIERESNHPVAKAICRELDKDGVGFLKIANIHEQPGDGIKGLVDDKAVFVGRVRFLKANGIAFSKEQENIISEEESQNHSIVAMSVDGKPAGFISFFDNIKPETESFIQKLKLMGIKKLIMLTGDNEKIASSVANKIHLTDFKANLMPEDKIKHLKELLNKSSKVVMVGDGVNDAAALAHADIGIAMGGIGSDAAIENADIVLMKDKLENIVDTINLGQQTMNVVYQNLFLWSGLQIFGLILVFNGVLNPSGAAAYNFITDFIPIINSLRLFRIKFKTQK